MPWVDAFIFTLKDITELKRSEELVGTIGGKWNCDEVITVFFVPFHVWGTADVSQIHLSVEKIKIHFIVGPGKDWTKAKARFL